MRVKHILADIRKEKGMAILMQAEKKQKEEKIKREARHGHKGKCILPKHSEKQENQYAETHRLQVKGKVTIHRCL
jgi:hypothetical protein